MKLSAALDWRRGDLVAFVGGGGKTMAMFRLAAELAAAGERVITTTTTRLGAKQARLAPACLVLAQPDLPAGQRAQIEAALQAHRHVLIVSEIDEAADKALGISPALAGQLACLPGVSTVLVEADGAQGKPLKAPAAHEPVIPAATTRVVPVMGADALGQPLTAGWVHRLDQIGALTGAAEGATITPELAARVLAHPQGGLKNAPVGAQIIPLINKVETPELEMTARETAERLLEAPGCEAVMIGAVQAADPIRILQGRVAAIVLAAGCSRRMGVPKQVLPWGEGGTIIGQVVGQLQQAGVAEIVVVTGGAREEVEAALRPGLQDARPRLRFVYNPDFAVKEMLSSLQIGLRSLPADCAAALVALGDQPQLEAGVARAVLRRWSETRAEAVYPSFDNRRGHPVLFDRRLWPAVLDLPDSASPRAVLSAARAEYVAVETASILRDVDTREDYEREKAARHDEMRPAST